MSVRTGTDVSFEVCRARVVGIGGAVALWVFVGLVTLLEILITLSKGQMFQEIESAKVVLTLFTVVGTLNGDTNRRSVGAAWVCLTTLGLFGAITGVGFGAPETVSRSLELFLVGILTTTLVLLPDVHSTSSTIPIGEPDKKPG